MATDTDDEVNPFFDINNVKGFDGTFDLARQSIKNQLSFLLQ